MKDYFKALKDFSKQNPLSSVSMEDRGFSNNNEANKFIKKNPFAFICGLIFDQSIKSSLAWQAPYFLRQRLGHLNLTIIADMNTDDLKNIIAQKPSLHRYPGPMAKNIIKSSQIIVDKYNSNAENIWNKATSSKEIKNNLLELGGIGEKKANLGVLMLYHSQDLTVNSLQGTELALDVHLIRVLNRSDRFKDTNTAEGKQKVNQEFKNYFGNDFSTIGTHLWIIGRKFCHETEPACLLCPLNGKCKKNISKTI